MYPARFVAVHKQEERRGSRRRSRRKRRRRGPSRGRFFIFFFSRLLFTSRRKKRGEEGQNKREKEERAIFNRGPTRYDDDDERETTAIIILLLEGVSRCRHNHVGTTLCSHDSDRAHLCQNTHGRRYNGRINPRKPTIRRRYASRLVGINSPEGGSRDARKAARKRGIAGRGGSGNVSRGGGGGERNTNAHRR